MSVLSKLNSIEVCEVAIKNGNATFNYFTNSEGFSASISMLLGIMQIADDVPYDTHCNIKPSSANPKDKSPDKHSYSFCFDLLKSNKIDDDINTQNM